MEKLGLNKIRDEFQNFYIQKEHLKRKSASLIPEKDKSLLIINSGMAPLKPFFAGIETPPAKRMTTCQKCIRTGDIDNVGLTKRHGTFFEMLGSFSFGNYFKTESLIWGWELITKVFKMPEDRIWATIYEDDEEAYDIWKNVIGMDPSRIVRLGKKDNFWEIGTGPCGPCSELYYDRGEEFGCGSPDCKPGCDCDRYIEFWNHVFTQFSKDEEGNYNPLEHPNIDTGMGLERIACIMQDVDSIFDVDTIKSILNQIVKISGVTYQNGEAATDVSIRIITDHIRSVTFMIGDGIIPSNEGRGYVLRRLLRRAARHGKVLGIEGPFLADLSAKVIEISGGAYEELENKRSYIHKIITIEEEKFSSTIDQGSEIIAEYVKVMKEDGKTVLDGEKAFKLHDTYGFPLELTEEILAEKGCSADIEGFKFHMEHQKELARAARKAGDDDGWKEKSTDFDFDGETVFTGYDKVMDSGKVMAIFWDKKPLDSIEQGEIARIIIDKSPFYAEGGGQSSDIGAIYNDNCQLKVLEVAKMQNIFVHKVQVTEGKLELGDEVTLVVNEANRNSTARNHTATHLLQKALKEVLGDHIQQAGSSVNATGLRFDFSHYEGISKENLAKIEAIVNDKILHFLPVTVEEMSMKEASNSGAMALFGEKYGNVVRVVSVGNYSKELCGGTHVKNSGQIGGFKILSESGVASGVRRIEAITGEGVVNKVKEQENLLDELAEILKSNRAGLINKLLSMTEEMKESKKELDEFKKKEMLTATGKMLEDAKEINGAKLVVRAFNNYNINDLRALSDDLKKDQSGLVMVFATENEGKVTFMVSITDDLLDKGYHAGKMIKEIAATAGGGGGGKADMAQAGAKDPSKIKDAFTVAEELMSKIN